MTRQNKKYKYCCVFVLTKFYNTKYCRVFMILNAIVFAILHWLRECKKVWHVCSIENHLF